MRHASGLDASSLAEQSSTANFVRRKYREAERRKLACHTEDQRSDSGFLEQRIRFWLDQSRATTAPLVTHSAADAPSSPSPQNLILECSSCFLGDGRDVSQIPLPTQTPGGGDHQQCGQDHCQILQLDCAERPECLQLVSMASSVIPAISSGVQIMGGSWPTCQVPMHKCHAKIRYKLTIRRTAAILLQEPFAICCFDDC